MKNPLIVASYGRILEFEKNILLYPQLKAWQCWTWRTSIDCAFIQTSDCIYIRMYAPLPPYLVPRVVYMGLSITAAGNWGKNFCVWWRSFFSFSCLTAALQVHGTVCMQLKQLPVLCVFFVRRVKRGKKGKGPLFFLVPSLRAQTRRAVEVHLLLLLPPLLHKSPVHTLYMLCSDWGFT